MMKNVDKIATRKAPLEAVKSRRTMLRGLAVGAASVGGLSLTTPLALAATKTSATTCLTPIADILTLARTAERLAVTFYHNGVKNAKQLGIAGVELDYIKTALIEEQLHENLFAQSGASVVTSTFSFPHGSDTFKYIRLFIETQQQLEGVFDSAYLAAVKELGEQGRPDLAQVAAQIACIEAEHRVLGRIIGNQHPADNWAYTPVEVSTVSDVQKIAFDAGYLSPKKGNSYTYEAVSTKDDRIINRTPTSIGCK